MDIGNAQTCTRGQIAVPVMDITLFPHVMPVESVFVSISDSPLEHLPRGGVMFANNTSA